MKKSAILIVEDEVLLAMDIRHILEEAGYRVAGISGDGQQAVDLAESTQADLVLMDIKLRGEMDGIEAARRIIGRSGVPVVFITGNVDRKTRAEADSTGPAGIVNKPVEEAELLAILKSALGGGPQGG